jgi:hypothetical protein
MAIRAVNLIISVYEDKQMKIRKYCPITLGAYKSS